MKSKFKKIMLGSGCLLAATLLVLIFCDHRVKSGAKGRLYSDAAQVPSRPVALVLGCSPRLANGRENYFYTFRMDAAAQLFKEGRAKIFLVSGDNRFHNYDEPSEMKKSLIARGIPEQNIVCDYAGRRTLDSVLRARDIFGQNRFIIVSQPFHNTRAVYIAEKNQIDAIGFNARDIETRAALRTYLREILARTKAVLDVEVFGVKPEIMGPPESMPAL